MPRRITNKTISNSIPVRRNLFPCKFSQVAERTNQTRISFLCRIYRDLQGVPLARLQLAQHFPTGAIANDKCFRRDAAFNGQ